MRLSRNARFYLSIGLGLATAAGGVGLFQDAGVFSLAAGLAVSAGTFSILTEMVRAARRERHRRRFE
jgi:hypothetical protein